MRRVRNVNSATKRRSIIRDAYGFEVIPSQTPWTASSGGQFFQVAQNLADLYSEHSATWAAEEKRRTDKWLHFLKDICPPEHQKKNVIFAGFWDDVLESSLRSVLREHKTHPHGTEAGDRLYGLIRIGIPSFLRGNVWGLLLGYDEERQSGLFRLLSTQSSPPHSRLCSERDGQREQRPIARWSSADSRELESLDENDTLSDAPPMFQWSDRCASTGRDGGTASCSEQAVEQINKDLDRTFPGHPLLDDSGKNALRQILVAFSLHRPDIGYCQGMNFIAGLLLLYHQPEDAFWNLASIIEHLLPNQFDRDMLPAVVDKLVFSHLVQQHFPELADHLNELSVDVSYLCPHWFLCCFVNALPMESCLRVWDILFWERKPHVLFKVALALVDFYSEELMSIRQTTQAWEQLQNMAAAFFDSSRLVETACAKFEGVNEERIAGLRRIYLDKVKEQSIKDLLGQSEQFGPDDGSTTTTPTKILAASASLFSRDNSGFSSSSSSSFGPRSLQDASRALRAEDNRRAVETLLLQLRDVAIPDEVTSRVLEVVDRLVESEQEGRDTQARLELSCKDLAKANDANRSLKSRLGAVYTELDKKNECLDCMIAKCQTLTEKVASQEEVICQQRRIMLGGTSRISGDGDGSEGVAMRRDRGTQSLRNLFAFRR